MDVSTPVDDTLACEQDPVQQLDGLDCPFRQASEAQLVEVLQLCSLDRDAAADSVATVLEQGHHKQDTRQQLRVTFTTLALSFAQQRQFSAAKCGVVFNITQTLLASVDRGDSREECEAVLKDCLAPLIKVHAMPDEPRFTAFDTGALAKFFADHLLAQFHLFSYVLLVDREMINTDVEKLVEVPWIPAFHGEVQTEQEWKDALEAKAAAEEEACKQEQAQAKEEEEAAELARIEKEKRDAEFGRKKALAAKPEKLEEAVEKLVRWRIESEKVRLTEAYMSEVNALRAELVAQQTAAEAPAGGKKGKGK